MKKLIILFSILLITINIYGQANTRYGHGAPFGLDSMSTVVIYVDSIHSNLADTIYVLGPTIFKKTVIIQEQAGELFMVTSDNDTCWFAPTNDSLKTLGITINGIYQLWVDSTGIGYLSSKLGITTDTPDSSLTALGGHFLGGVDIDGDLNVDGTMTFTNATVDTMTVNEAVLPDASGGAVLGSTGLPFGSLHAGKSNISLDHLDASDGDPDSVVIVTAAGNVGIGVTPSRKLEIKDTSNQIKLTYDLTHYTEFIADGAGNLRIVPSGSEIYMVDKDIVMYADSPIPANIKIRLDISGNTYFLGGSVGIGITDPETITEIAGTEPFLTLHNTTEEDIEGGRPVKVIGKGEKSGGEEFTQGLIQMSHNGTGDDESTDMIFAVNDGDDGNTPTEAMRIDKQGRLGIGRSPGTELDVYNSGTVTSRIESSDGEAILSMTGEGTGNASSLQFRDTGANTKWNLAMRSADHATAENKLTLAYFDGSSWQNNRLTFAPDWTEERNGLIEALKDTSLADDASKTFPSGIAGWGSVFIGDNEEFTRVRWTSAGVVTLEGSTANVTSTGGSDGNFNIYQSGTSIVFENKLGATKAVSYVLYWK